MCLLVAFAAPEALAQAGVPYLAEPPSTTPAETPAALEPREAPLEGKRKARELHSLETPADAPAAETVAVAAPPYAPAVFAELWKNRRAARAVGQEAEAKRLLGVMIENKQKSGWPDLFAYGEALARESRQVVDKNAAQAVELATAAVALAPHRAATHAAQGQALWRAGNHVGASITAFARAYVTSFTEPSLRLARLGNFMLAFLAAAWFAALVFSVAVLYAHVRMLVHDLLHMLPTGASRLQSGILGVAVFLAPVFFRVGAAWTVLVWLAAVGLYYRRRERIAAILVLALFALVPIALPFLTRFLAYPGSRAEAMYLAARDLGATAAAERLARGPNPTPEELHVLGLRARWSGDLARAAQILSRAEAAGRSDASLFTTLANIRYLLGDKKAAIDYYQKATRADPDHAIAFINMARVYYDLTEHQKAGDAHRRATAIDDALVERYKRGEGVIEGAVPAALLRADAGVSGNERAVEHLWELIGTRRTPRYHFAALSLTAMLAVALLGWLRTPLRPSVRCGRCGRAACVRCTPEMPNQGQCGQCYHAFVAKVTVDAQARIQKEIEVHRYQARTSQIRRVLSLVVAGTAQLLRGDSLRGLGFFALSVIGLLGLGMALDLVPEPLPVLTGVSYPSAVLAGLLFLGSYALSLWHAQRLEK